jgi:sensor histidine kinase regulating citrate/malate metabolism
LYTIFWNLWINAHQAVDGDCKIMVRAMLNAKQIDLLIVDNGSGFPQELVGVVFQERYSAKGAHRGRGLLEVQDAVHQLRGKAQLVPYGLGDFRVMLSFPLGDT